LLTTALTLLGLLLPSSAAAILYVAHLGRISDAGFLLAALTLYPVILFFTVWALAGSMRYADENDQLVFPVEAGWAYVGAYGATYALLLAAVVLTTAFFMFRSEVLLAGPPGRHQPATVTLARQPIRVGDSRAMVIALWGRPDSVGENPPLLYYSRLDSVIAVKVDSRDSVRAVLIGEVR